MNRKMNLGLILSLFLLTLLAKSAAAGTVVSDAPAQVLLAAPSKPVSKLSPRLFALAQSGILRAASVAEQAAALSVAAQGGGSLTRDAQGRLLVEIRSSDFSQAGLQALRDTGAIISGVSERYGIISVFVNASDLNALASIAAVQNVHEVLAPMTAGNISPMASQSESLVPLACPQGNAVSEGDVQLRANLARTTHSVDGSGVYVGVLSDSYAQVSSPTTAAQDVTSGDLPGTTNPCGHTTPVGIYAVDPSGTTDEGRGMLQIVHDVAPAATLRFATAYYNQTDFAYNIRALRTAGTDIIVDDITYLDEPFFQDGIVTVAISDVVSAGALYFTSAANSNVILGGNNVSSNEATAYRPTTCPAPVTSSFAAESCHNFNATGGTQNSMDITLSNGGYVYIVLQWAQPWYGVTTDLDISMMNNSNTSFLAWSASVNPGGGGTQKPWEYFFYQNLSGSTQTYHIYVSRYTAGGYTGTPRVKLMIFKSALLTAVSPNVSSGSDIVGPAIMGHAASNYAFSVAAARYNDDNNPETFSSRGPATHYFGPILNTTPAAAITPETIQQPDFTASDGGCTTFFAQFQSGCWRFYGTSAAAPHAAAVTALLKQKANALGKPLSRSTAKWILTSTARSMSGGNVNSVGAGLLDALAATQRVVDMRSLYLPLILK